MTLPNAAYQAAADWQNAQDESADTSTAIDALGRLIAAIAEQDAAFYTIVAAAATLLLLYVEHGTDPDGEASVAMTDLLQQANLL